MKRILLTAFFLVGVVLSLSAKFEYITAYVLGTNNQVMNYRIDRDAKMFYFAGDSPEETDMEMRNYKKNGNTETFDIYAKYGGKKVGSVVLIIDPSLSSKDDLSGQTITVKAYGTTEKYNVKNEKQSGVRSSGGSSDGGSVVDKTKNKAKGLFDKGKGLFKKKNKK